MWNLILTFMNKERIAIVFLCILCLGLYGNMKYKTSVFHDQMQEQIVKYEALQKDYFVEMTNANTLRMSIESQNQMIEKYKNATLEFESEIDELNLSLEKKNKELKKLINTTKKIVPESVKTSEDAIKWLRENAYTLR